MFKVNNKKIVTHENIKKAQLGTYFTPCYIVFYLAGNFVPDGSFSQYE